MMNDRSKAEQDKATWQRRIDEALSRIKNDARRDLQQVVLSSIRSEGTQV